MENPAKMTVATLRKELERKGIRPPSRALKATLVNLMLDSQQKEQQSSMPASTTSDVSKLSKRTSKASQDLLTLEQGVLSYKYCSPNLSLSERTFLDDFWGKVVLWYPTWLAPNLITLGGALCEIIAFLLLWLYSPTMDNSAPVPVYFLVALLHFLYQTLDGSDGKQARRTKSGSSMGELFDHGVDAHVCVLFTCSVIDVIGVGLENPIVWIILPMVQFAFYASNMTLLHFGKQEFHSFDVIEIQLTSIVGLILSPLFPGIWTLQVSPALDEFLKNYPSLLHLIPTFGKDFITWTSIFVCVNMFGLCFNVSRNFLSILLMYLGVGEKSAPVLQKRLGTGFKSMIYHMIIILVHVAAFFYCGTYISSAFNGNEKTQCLRLLLLVGSFSFADLMDRLLILRVTQFYNLVPVSLFVMTSLACFCCRGSISFDVVVLHLILAAAIHLSFFASSVSILSKIMGVHPFKIKTPNSKGD